MSADSSGPGKPGSSPGSSKPETHRGDANGSMQGGGAEGGPSSSQHKLGNDPSKYATKQHEESIGIGVEKNRHEPSRQTGEKVDVKSIHGKTSRTPNPEAGKPPLPQSPKIPADPTDPSKCKTDPDDEIQFIDSVENRQGPPEQSTPQTKGAISLHEKTSWTPNPKAGDSHFSKSCSSTGHELLSIQWNMKQETKGNEPFEIILYNGKHIKYVIQITCMPEDFYRLKFMFCNTNTVEDLSKSLLEIDCTLKSGTYEVHLGRKILSDKSEIIKDKIEGVINNVKATSNIQVHCAEIRIAEDKLVKKCEEFSSEFKRGNIAVYKKGKRVWIVARNNEEMEVLEKRLIEDNVLQKAPYCLKDGDKNHQGSIQTIPPTTESSQTVLENSLHESSTHTGKKEDVAMLLNSYLSATTSKSLSSGDSFKKSLVKTKVIDMSEMTKETSSDQKHTYHNLFLGQTEKAASDSSKGGEQSAKKMPINVQLDTQDVKEFDLPCSARHYFKWLYCLSNEKCLITLKRFCNEQGIDLNVSRDKCPVFVFPLSKETVIEQLQHPFEETAKQHDITYHVFDWDLERSEKDFIGFCSHWNDIQKQKKCPNVLLFCDGTYGQMSFCLVGERPAVDTMKPSLKSELERYSDSEFATVQPYIWEEKVNDAWFKIFEKVKETLERDFKVTASCGPDFKVKVTAASQDAITGVIKKVGEISNSIKNLKLRYEYLEFLNRSESARLYLEQQLRKRKRLKLHFLDNDEYDTVKVFEENNNDLEDVSEKIQNWLFYIPSTDELCQIFSFDEGKKEFSRLVQENKEKVLMVLDGLKQPCCVGTVDIKEKTENTLSRYSLKTDHVKLPSQEVWEFCARHHMFEGIAKEESCEVKFAENKEYQWCVEVRGPIAFISKCCDKIEKEIRNVKSETVLLKDYDSFDESTVANLIQKWNAEKRCFVNTKCVKAKAPAPWKKWIEKKEMGVKMTYFVNFNSSPEIHDNELKLVLIPEEQTGAKSKNLCVPMPGQSVAQISVPSSKTRDLVERGLKEALKMNKEQWGKGHLIVDCKRIPEKELKMSMGIICFTLDNSAGLSSCITMCEFCDTRLEMFDCMIKIIDAKFFNKGHFQVLEWKGRSIEIDVKSGQLAQQKGFDVLVNSTSWNLDLNAGLTSRSLLKAAGPGIQQECKKQYRGGIYTGGIAVTEGHNLNCKHVFHGYILPYSTKENFQSLRRMIRNCLETADKMKMESIAFPALGTGSLGYDRQDVANVLFGEVEKYENKVRLGSLSRLCCVIYQDDIDAVQIFQKRHLKWNEDHKWQTTSKEVVVTSDKPDVIEEIFQVFQQLKCSTATNLEPPIAEITKNIRLGNPPTEDPKNGHTKKQIQQSRQNADYSMEEKRCLLIKTKENSEKDHLNVWERNLREDFENLAENIVCPFNSPNVALVQFASMKDVEDISNDDNFKKKYSLQRFPPQAVVGVEAVISPRMIELLKKKSVTAKVIRRKSGALIRKNDTNALVLCGNILEIKAAHNFFATLMKEGSHGITQEERPVSKAAENIIRGENLSEMQHVSNIDNATYGKSMSADNSKTYSLKQPSVTGINEFSKSRQIPSPVAKLDDPKVLEDIQCSYEEATLLKYFLKNLMANVEIITVPDYSVVALQFHDEDTRRRVGEYLNKLKHMPRATCPLPDVADITKTVATKCSDDTLCYISNDRKQIIIIGEKKDNVIKIKEELNMLSEPEIQMTEKPDESSKMPVLVTNEGVSVFVYCASLLDLQTPVDAIVCPLSKLDDLEYGLPKYIAETTRFEHDTELRKMFRSNENIFPDHSVIQLRTKNIKSCKYVVYVSTHRTQLRERSNDPVACEQFLLQLMLQIFVKVENYGIQRIAIPAVCSGKNGFTKEICAQCYGTSVMKYSRTIRFDAEGLSEIHFVDKSAEMILYIESVFTQPDLIDTFEAKAQDLGQPSSKDQSLYPYSAEDGTFCLSENRCLTVIDSNDLKHQKDRTLVYHNILSKMDKWKVITDLIPEEEKKQLKKFKRVAFFTNGLITSKFDYIVLPVLGENMDLDEFEQILSSFYFSIFQEAEKQQITKMVIPLYGFSKGHDRVAPLCARCLSLGLKNIPTRPSLKSTRLDVVVAVDDKPTKNSVMKEIGNLIESERAGFWQVAGNPNRSHKRTKQMHKLQKQPNGRISFKTTKTRLKDFKCGTIEIQVTIPDGIQQSFHPNPGKRFIGRKETLFLPNNILGRSFALMIEKAFKQKILYEVETNTTQRIEMVVGNNTHLISKRENFPDPKQLQSLHGILKKKLESF